MRTTAESNGLTFSAYAGTTAVQLAWDIEEPRAKDLLGFAVKRTDARHPDGVWLEGGIGFPGQQHPPGEFKATNEAPIQAFRWGDYTVYPGGRYTYELVPMYAPWDGLRAGPSASVDVVTEDVRDGKHEVAFNRAVAASQAYSRKFGDADPHDDAEARAWLARGLDSFILHFAERATGPEWALDFVIYEYELEKIRDALKAARERGASVRLVYHAGTKAGDTQTPLNETNVAADGWSEDVRRGRVTSSICHDKFIVLSRLVGGERRPEAVLTGSTNWTFNGLYYQGNVAHVVNDRDFAQRYLAMFEELFGGASQSATRTWIADHDPVDGATDPEVVFSPRTHRSDLDHYVELIGATRRSLFFMTTFRLDDDFLAALAGTAEGTAPRRLLRYGLQNSASAVTGYNREIGRNFTATNRAQLRTAPDGFLRESTHGQVGDILIHTKIVLLDFDTAEPLVISGSSNYSYNSSYYNDENAFIVRRDTRVADIYVAEMFRLFDHYRFRYNWSNPPEHGPETFSNVERRVVLDVTDAWTRSYFDGDDPHSMERRQLAHPER